MKAKAEHLTGIVAGVIPCCFVVTQALDNGPKTVKSGTIKNKPSKSQRYGMIHGIRRPLSQPSLLVLSEAPWPMRQMEAVILDQFFVC